MCMELLLLDGWAARLTTDVVLKCFMVRLIVLQWRYAMTLSGEERQERRGRGRSKAECSNLQTKVGD